MRLNTNGAAVPGTREKHLAPLESRCLRDTSAVLNELHASVRLTILNDPDRFRARLASISVAHSRYSLISYGTAVRVECAYDLPSESAILCLRGSCVIRVDGEIRKLIAGEGLIGRPRSGLSAEFSHDCERLVIRTRHREKSPMAQSLVEDLAFGVPYLRGFAELIAATAQSPALLSCISTHPSVSRPFHELIGQLLASARVTSRSTELSAAPIPRAVRRVEAMVRQRPGEPLTCASLAAAAGVSERALQSQFRKYRQCTPMQFVRDSRLALANAILSQASTTESVGSVALRCGFNHLARFASDYQLRFGEYPSETRQKARSADRPL